MGQTLKILVDRYKNNLLETSNLQISKQTFRDETLHNEIFTDSTFKNLSLLNCNFVKGNFKSSLLEDACLRTILSTVQYLSKLNLKIAPLQIAD